MTTTNTPSGLWPHFQEYDPQRLDRDQDADLIIQPDETVCAGFCDAWRRRDYSVTPALRVAQVSSR